MDGRILLEKNLLLETPNRNLQVNLETKTYNSNVGLDDHLDIDIHRMV